MNAARSSFLDALHAKGPAPDRTDKLALYGWLVGSWSFDATLFDDNGAHPAGEGHIHFDWVLAGRAIQDVWVLPGVFHGTTLRIFDPSLDAWHILWNDPVKQYYTRQIGRAQGDDIVQEGTADNGDAIRWSFCEIAPDSFRWRGERTAVPGGPWHMQADFRARRAVVR